MNNLRALAVLDAFAGRSTLVRQRDTRRLIFDQLPLPVRNRKGEIVGVEVMVRLFEGTREIRIDGHRRIINPPTVPRANLTYEEGSLDADFVAAV
mgnify:CR=1 FL=1